MSTIWCTPLSAENIICRRPDRSRGACKLGYPGTFTARRGDQSTTEVLCRVGSYRQSCTATRWPQPSRPTARGLLTLPATAAKSDHSRNDNTQPFGVVITGGTKGVGFALAREFLSYGDKVLICGRDAERTAAAKHALQEEFGEDAKVFATSCDVSSPSDVAELARTARATLGLVHHWVNNAGMASRTRCNLVDMEPAEILEVSGTNVTGSLLCCREAARLMKKQPPAPHPIYHIYNCGFSAWGASFSASTAPHKSTKRALAQLTDSLSKELAQSGVTSIGVHQLSPGMVLTDLLLEEASAGARKFFNVMAEEPETVAASLVPQMRSIEGTRGAVEFLTPFDALRRVLTGIPAIVNGGRFFDKDGNRVRRDGCEYQSNGVRRQF